MPHAAGCTLLGARGSHGCCTPLARAAHPRRSRGRSLQLGAGPLHARRTRLRAHPLHDCWGGGSCTASSRCTPLRACCLHGRRGLCTPATGSLHSPEAILGAAAGPAQDGAVEQPGRAQGSRSLTPQPHGGPRLPPSPRAKLRTLKAPSAFTPCAHGGPRAPSGRGRERTPRGCGAVPPPQAPPPAPAPGHPNAQHGDPAGVGRWRCGRAAGPGREARAALCPSVSFYGADKEELQE